jgi:hypothetical protein
MKKHVFNILPEIQGDDYKKLLNDIQKNGYDIKFPIYLYEGDIIDGWQRYLICQKLGIIPVYETFEGTKLEAIQFILRTNKRRNLTSSQWAAIANEATDIINELEKQAKERNLANLKQGNEKPVIKKVLLREQGTTVGKLADIFPTNTQYIQEAKRIKRESPEIFEQIKSGEKTISQVKREQSPTPIENDSDPFFYQTSKLLTQSLDHLERILQEEHIPKTKKDFIHIDSINHELYRLVRLAGQIGVDIKTVWEKMAERHGFEIEVPKYLKRPSTFEDNITNIN